MWAPPVRGNRAAPGSAEEKGDDELLRLVSPAGNLEPEANAPGGSPAGESGPEAALWLHELIRNKPQLGLKPAEPVLPHQRQSIDRR